MPQLELKKLQQRFKKAVTSPGSRQSPAWLGVRDTPPIDYDRRLDIYQYAYFARLHESLRDDFEELVKVVGDKAFEKICRLYLAKYPSHYASLAELGRRLPQFLSETAPWKNKKALAALAGFEWEVFVASVTANPKLAVSAGGAPMAAPVFFLHPAVRLYHSKYEVDRVRKKRIAKAQKILHWVIYRDGQDIYWLRISPVQHEVLALMAQGHPMENLIATFQKRKVSQKQAAGWFRRWAENNIITGLQNAQAPS